MSNVPSKVEVTPGFRRAVDYLLRYVGEDPRREGLVDTPRRMSKAFAEWFSGYNVNPETLFRSFQDGAEKCDEMILVANNPVWSHCEHHLTPFFGYAHIAYVPNGKILGLSKFSRLVEVYARRCQVQERITNQVADCLEKHLRPVGIGVVLECRHLCLESRGVRARGAVTTTSAMRGALRSNPAARAEFFSLVQSASKSAGGL